MRRVIAAAGRRIDAPAACSSSFPVARIGPVRRLILERLLKHDVDLVISSAACGADLLVLDAATELSISYRILLPSTIETFRRSSVIDCDPSPFWADIYDRVTAGANERNDLIENVGAGQASDYREVNTAILEKALFYAGEKASSAIALVIWDGKPHLNRDDLTAEFKEEAQTRGFRLDEIFTI